MELISYSIDFISFLIQNLNHKKMNKIKSIILFGSVARGEEKKGSDVDIFIDVLDKEKEIEKEVFNIRDNFVDSIKYKKYWKLLGVKNEINTIVGKLKEWKLRESMLGNSIILYQKYSPVLEKGENKAILIWGVVKNNSKRVMLNKKLFGFDYYKKHYNGLIKTYNGEKLGSNVIKIPAEYLNLFLKEFYKFKIAVKINMVFEYKT